MQWAQERLLDPDDQVNWLASAGFTLTKIFDNIIAESVGLWREQYSHFGENVANRFVAMLAYSTDDHGGAAGNSGATAFLNNSILLGQALLEGFEFGATVGTVIAQHTGFLLANYVVNAHTNDLLEYTAYNEGGELRIHFDEATWTFHEETVVYNALPEFTRALGVEIGGQVGGLFQNSSFWSDVTFIISDSAVTKTLDGSTAWIGTGKGDTLTGSSDSDFIFAGQSSSGGAGAHIYGGDGWDSIYGSRFNDVIDGGADSDYIFGGEGDDEFFNISEGESVTSGGSGNDTFHLEQPESGFTFVYGGSGADIFDITGNSNIILLNVTFLSEEDNINTSFLYNEARKYAQNGIVIINAENTDIIKINGHTISGAACEQVSQEIEYYGNITGDTERVAIDFNGDGVSDTVSIPIEFSEIIATYTGYRHLDDNFRYSGTSRNNHSILQLYDRDSPTGGDAPSDLISSIAGFTNGIAGISITENNYLNEIDLVINKWLVNPESWTSLDWFNYVEPNWLFSPSYGTVEDWFSSVTSSTEHTISGGEKSIRDSFFNYLSKILIDTDDVVNPPYIPDLPAAPTPPPYHSEALLV